MPDVRSTALDTGKGGTVSAKCLILAPCAQYRNGLLGMEPGLGVRQVPVRWAQIVNNLPPLPRHFS